MRISACALTLALVAARAEAQLPPPPPDPVSCSVLCPDGHFAPSACASNEDVCGGGGTSSANMEAARQAEAKRFQSEVDEAMRAGTEEQQRAFRRANDRGIEAYKLKQWDRAVQSFEAAQRLDPSSSLVVENLQHSREEQAAERARKLAAAAPLKATDLRLPPPPSPLAPPSVPPLVIALGTKRDSFSRTVPEYDLTRWLAPARRAVHEATSPVPEFLKNVLFDVMESRAKIAPYHWIEVIQSTRDLSAAYRRGVTGLVEKVEIEIFTGTDQTEAGGQDITQFADDKLRESIWGNVRAWGSHRAAAGTDE